MAVIICPWCQSEIPQEEGAEPEKYCPVCENELDGYRTLTFGIGSGEEEEEDEAAYETEQDTRSGGLWRSAGLKDEHETLLQAEETVEALLDEQDAVPECPHCREYMLEAGEQRIEAGSFRPRVSEALGQAVLAAPFSLTLYVCPSCFAAQYALAEPGRSDLSRRLSESKPSDRS